MPPLRKGRTVSATPRQAGSTWQARGSVAPERHTSDSRAQPGRSRSPGTDSHPSHVDPPCGSRRVPPLRKGGFFCVLLSVGLSFLRAHPPTHPLHKHAHPRPQNGTLRRSQEKLSTIGTKSPPPPTREKQRKNTPKQAKIHIFLEDSVEKATLLQKVDRYLFIICNAYT